MYVGYGALELHLPHARDLKAKRRVVRALVERLHARYRLSAAETDHHDLCQRAEIGVAVVAADIAAVERILDEVGRLAESEVEAMVLDWSPVVVGGEE
jgi:hypothetical protein